MPVIPSRLMESSIWHGGPFDWNNVYLLLAPQVNVRGRMALVLLVAVVWAFGWLLWRAYSVIQTPNDILVDKLGLDIPPPPLVTLEDIGPSEIQISWKPAETTASIHENHIEVNGRLTGVTKKHDTAVAIHNLRPATTYDIRIFSVSAGRFQTPSSLLHIRTSAIAEEHSSHDHTDQTPAVRVLAPRNLPTPSVLSAPIMARESSGGPVGRRGTTGRRLSPAGNNDGSQSDGLSRGVEEESDASLVELSQQLQKVQQDIEAIDVQIQDEDKESENAIKEKEAERNELRTNLKERDEISSNLRREVHKAETANRTAQSEKSKKERLLDQKQSQRKKRKDDMAKWERESALMVEEVDMLKNQQGLVERKKESDIMEVRQKIEEEQREVVRLEEENKEKALEIKALEEERQQIDAEEETEETREADRAEMERTIKWQERINNLRDSYSRILHDLQQAHHQHSYLRERLDVARRQASYTYASPVPLDVEVLRRAAKPVRRNRHASSHGSNVSSPMAAFGTTEPYNMNSHFSNAVNASPTTVGPSFFNPQNGMTLMLPSDPIDAMIDEPELLTSAPMSPRADALLPADLLGDESADEFMDEPDDISVHAAPVIVEPQSRSRENSREGEESPMGDNSSSPRSFASPREEFGSNNDWDHQSIHSQLEKSKETEIDKQDANSTNSRKHSTMSNLFSFNRQRGKTLADQPPLLGSLKPGQSQSFPRNYDEFDPSAQPRRRLSYGGNWQFPGSSLLGRGNSTRETERLSASRRGLPGLFSKSSAVTQSYDPFAPDAMRPEASSSRPSSVYSFDVLPRPSVESQFHAWGIRNSPLAPTWSSLSRNHSRRPSIGYGSTSNLPMVTGGDEDYLQPSRELQRPLQAPIGTRPVSSQRPATPKLNPAAPSFTMFFAKSREKAKEKAKAKEKDKEATPRPGELDGNSPPESRQSRDTHSIAATTSTYESRDSLERTPSGYSGGTPVETTPSKPTFISKITRKASSNKFGSWKGQGGLFSRKDPATPTGEPEDENHILTLEQLGKSYESMASTPGEDKDKKASRTSLGSWNFMRKSKKGGDKREDLAASEISESAGSQRGSVDVTEEEEEEDE